MIFSKLQKADDRYREIEQMMTLPEIVGNNKRYAELIKEYKSLEPIIEKFREYKEADRIFREAEEMMRESGLDSELRDLAEEEYKEYKVILERLTEEIKILLMPKDPNDSRNVIVEIRQGAGAVIKKRFSPRLVITTVYDKINVHKLIQND